MQERAEKFPPATRKEGDFSITPASRRSLKPYTSGNGPVGGGSRPGASGSTPARRWQYRTSLILGTVTYFPSSNRFLGRPMGSGRSRRPSACSTLLRNASDPSGRPVCVQSRRFSTIAPGFCAPRPPPLPLIQPPRHRAEVAVHGGARPAIAPGHLHHPRSHRVALHIPQGRPRLLHRTGVEAVLPEMPAASMQPVQVLRVLEVRAPHRLGERLLPRRHDEEVHVVGHQAVPRETRDSHLFFSPLHTINR